MKTTITKIFAIILAAVMCASFAACKQSEPENDTNDNKSDGASNSPLVNVAEDDKQGDDGSAAENDGDETEDDADSPEEDMTAGEESTTPEESTAPEEDAEEGTAPEEDAEEGNDPEEDAGSNTEDGEDTDIPEKEDDTETAVITTENEQQPPSSDKGEAVAQTAESTVGYDFLFGGDSPEEGGFDNSGVIYYAFTQNGISCPRALSEIFKAGAEVGYDELGRGDAVFFRLDDGSDTVFGGIYVGDGKAVMSFSEGIPVHIVDVATDYYKATFVKGVRLAN